MYIILLLLIQFAVLIIKTTTLLLLISMFIYKLTSCIRSWSNVLRDWGGGGGGRAINHQTSDICCFFTAVRKNPIASQLYK